MVIFLRPFGGSRVPHYFINLFIFKTVKNAIGANQNVVQLLRAVFFIDDLRFPDDDTLGPAKMRKFSLAITERAADG